MKQLSVRLADRLIDTNNPVFRQGKYHAVVLEPRQGKLAARSASQLCNVQLVLEEANHPTSKRQMTMRANSGGGLFYFTVYRSSSDPRVRRTSIVGYVMSYANDPYIYMVYSHDV